VKLRLAIDADDKTQARAIATEVFQAMDVAAQAGDLEVTHSANRQPSGMSSPNLTCRQ
jgi:hypothetical protein